ncbi:MAG: hypothetical protein II490_02425, partial [Oscillospiraceae bacterium]|nr:hypothetical protein [Oscillospiraceae bacterium]
YDEEKELKIMSLPKGRLRFLLLFSVEDVIKTWYNIFPNSRKGGNFRGRQDIRKGSAGEQP